MNILKIQTEILKALWQEKKVGTYNTSDDLTFVTISPAAVGYFIPRHLLRVDLTDAQTTSPFMEEERQAGCLESNLLIETDTYRVGGGVRKYRRNCDSAPVYIDTSLLKVFDTPQLYQQPGMDGKRPILVAENGRVAGIVMPYNVEKIKGE